MSARHRPDTTPWLWTKNPIAMLGLWALLAGLLACRDPAALLHAEFWGEDGWAWFPGAYNDGVRSLTEPVAGYFQTVSRLVGLLVQPFPMAWAPTLFAATALSLQALPAAYLVSTRMHEAWPRPLARLLFALIWIALPNTREVYANLTNVQWHLAALAFLVLLSTPAHTWPGRLFDRAMLLLSGLSGPFCLFLLPVAAWQAARRRNGPAALRASIVLFTTLIQGATLLANAGDRTGPSLGATPALLARIVAQQVVLAPFIGQQAITELQAWAPWQSNILPIAAALAALLVTAVAICRGPALLRAACCLSGAILLASLASPVITNSDEQWRVMIQPGVGQRYYFLPMLAWIGVLFGMALARPVTSKAMGSGLLCLLLIGIAQDWTIPPRSPTDFPALATRFIALPQGSVMTFPINPFMEKMPMILVR